VATGLRRLAIVVLCFGQLVLPAFARASDLRISHQWAPGVDARDRAARVFVAEVTKRLPSVKISIHPRSSLGIKPAEQYDAMLDGRVEMAIFPMFYLSPRIPELSITLLPGIPATTEQAQLLKGSRFHKRFQEFCESQGIHVLTWWWLAGGIVSRAPPIGGPATFRGLSVRSGDPNFDLMFEALGATTQIIDSTEIAPAMQNGELDAALASLESLVSLNIFKQAKYALVGGNAIYVSLHPLMISMKVWNRLSPAEKAAFEQAARLADADFLKSQTLAEQRAVSAFKDAGASVRPMTFEEHIDFVRAANATSWNAYREISEPANELLESMMRSFIESGRRQ
jgi:TRAP-type C4-dicarboxylate transport system substrate-binding protein